MQNPFEEITEKLKKIELYIQEINERERLKYNALNQKAFYSPKEFEGQTGMKYSTVVNHCKLGKLKARQNAPNCGWQISVDEIERFKKEASENV